MCTSTPPQNAQGTDLSLAGVYGAQVGKVQTPDGTWGPGTTADLNDLTSTSTGRIMLNNWMTGGKPPPVDPTVKIAETEHMSGVHQLAQTGSGYGGAFGNMGGQNFMSPNQPNTPAAPMPTLPPLGRGR